MRTTDALPIDHQPTIDPWVIHQLRQDRNKPVDISESRCRVEGVPRLAMHTVWRTPNERVPTMKVNLTDEVIVVSRLREAVPNPFTLVGPAVKGKPAPVAPIELFADGKTRRLELDEGDSLSGTIDRLRVAAKSLTPPKGVRVAYDGDRKTARAFRFELIPYTERKKSDSTEPE